MRRRKDGPDEHGIAERSFEGNGSNSTKTQLVERVKEACEGHREASSTRKHHQSSTLHSPKIEI